MGRKLFKWRDHAIEALGELETAAIEGWREEATLPIAELVKVIEAGHAALSYLDWLVVQLEQTDTLHAPAIDELRVRANSILAEATKEVG